MKYAFRDYFNAGIVLSCLCLFVFVAGEINKPSWDVSSFDYEGQKGVGYSLNLPNDQAYCRVESYDNGELRIYGNDYNWYEKIAVNYVRIKGVADVLRINKGSYSYNRTTKDHEFKMIKSGAYDVFYVKCLPHSNRLPKEARKMFRGYYGVK